VQNWSDTENIFVKRLLKSNTSVPALTLAKKLIDKKMEVIQQCVNNKEDLEGEYLTYLLSNTQMSIKDVYANIAELLLAGVDTVNQIPYHVIETIIIMLIIITIFISYQQDLYSKHYIPQPSPYDLISEHISCYSTYEYKTVCRDVMNLSLSVSYYELVCPWKFLTFFLHVHKVY